MPFKLPPVLPQRSLCQHEPMRLSQSLVPAMNHKHCKGMQQRKRQMCTQWAGLQGGQGPRDKLPGYGADSSLTLCDSQQHQGTGKNPTTGRGEQVQWDGKGRTTEPVPASKGHQQPGIYDFWLETRTPAQGSRALQLQYRTLGGG